MLSQNPLNIKLISFKKAGFSHIEMDFLYFCFRAVGPFNKARFRIGKKGFLHL